MVPCSLLAENIFSVFRSPHSAPTHRYTILDSRLLPCNAISEGRLFITNKKSPATAGLIKKSSCSWTFLLVYKGLKFFKSILFQSFSGNHFSPRFMVPCSLLAENIFSVFRSPHLPLDTLIKKSSCSWTFYY